VHANGTFSNFCPSQRQRDNTVVAGKSPGSYYANTDARNFPRHFGFPRTDHVEADLHFCHMSRSTSRNNDRQTVTPEDRLNSRHQVLRLLHPPLSSSTDLHIYSDLFKQVARIGVVRPLKHDNHIYERIVNCAHSIGCLLTVVVDPARCPADFLFDDAH
jgi:hypothetical protein